MQGVRPRRAAGAAVRAPTPGAGLALGLAVLLAMGLAVATLSAYWGWRLSHPPRRLPRENPGVAAHLIWRCLPMSGTLPPCRPGRLPLQRDAVPLSGWILPVPPPGQPRPGTGPGHPSRGEPEWPGTNPGQWSRRTVVFVSGHGQNRLQQGVPIYDIAAQLTAAGYNVVLFDTRGTGASGGAAIGFGALEWRDVVAVVGYLRTLGPPGGEVAVWGFGSGADAALLAAAADPHIAAVIADSPYASLSAYLRRNVPAWTGLPAFPFAWTVPAVMGAETGVSYGAVQPLRAAAALGARAVPLLLVAGTADPVTPASGVLRLYAAAADKDAETFLVPEAGHLQAFAREPTRYMRRVLAVLSEMP
jgi:alpha-beta hydrolase superfamily lysophospholipase